MANKQKKTQKELYTELLAICQTDEQKEFIQSRIEQLAKKSTSKKETEKQSKNLELAKAVYDYMQKNISYTVTDLMKQVPELQAVDPLSNQYVTSLMGILRDKELVVRIFEKNRAKFIKKFSDTTVEDE